MPQFKLITSNYSNVVKLLLPLFGDPDFDHAKNKIQIKKDLSRTPYFSQYLSTDDIKKRLEHEFFSHKTNSFDQGSFMGGILHTYTATTLRYLEFLPQTTYFNIDPTDINRYILLCYVNDKNELCGFGLEIIADEVKNPPSQKFHYGFVIYKNITSPPEQRTVILVADDKLLESTIVSEEIPTTDVLKILKEQLESDVLFEALTPIFMGGGENISKPAFDRLVACTYLGNRNSYQTILKLNTLYKEYQKNLENIQKESKEFSEKKPYFSRNARSIMMFGACVIIAAGAIGAIIFAAPLVVTIVGGVVLGMAALLGTRTIRKWFNNEKKYHAITSDNIAFEKSEVDRATQKLNKKIDSLIKAINPKYRPLPPLQHNAQHFPSPISGRDEPKPTHNNRPKP